MKLFEYLKLIPKGIKNADKLIEGIKNDSDFINGKLTKEEAEEIIRRRIICNECPFLSTNAVNNGLYKTDRDDEHCSLCSCNKDWKTACLSCNCGIEEYNKQNPENKIDLKWTAFKKDKNEEN